MTAYYDDIRSALETRLSGLSGIPSVITYENMKLKPTTGTAFLQTYFVPTSRRRAYISATPQMRYEGLFIVNVHVPENTGPGVADDYANIIIEGLDANTQLSFTNPSAETIYVSCDYAERTNGIEESPWYRVPVTINWFSYK